MLYLVSNLSFWLVLFFLFGLLMGFFFNSSEGE